MDYIINNTIYKRKELQIKSKVFNIKDRYREQRNNNYSMSHLKWATSLTSDLILLFQSLLLRPLYALWIVSLLDD